MKKSEDAYRKTGGLLKNMAFIIKAMARFEPAFFVLIPLGVFTTTSLKYLWNFFLKFVIDLIEKGANSVELVKMVGIFVGVQLMISMLDSLFTNEVFWRYMHVRFELIYEKNRKIMSMDYENLENKELMDCYKRADNACSSNKEGVEGMLRVITNLSIYTFVTLVGAFIMGTLEPMVVLLIMALSVASFFVLNAANRKAKKDVWDPITTWQRKQTYMQNATMDFSGAKEIRMYNLRSWLLEKYAAVNKVFYNAQKSNEKIQSVATISYHVLWTICQAAIYAWLLYCVLYRNLTIGSFTLYVASTTTLFEGLKRWLDEVAKLLARNREVNDFRAFMEIPTEDDDLEEIPVNETGNYIITFQNVSFKYPNSDNYALKNLNLTIEAGERLAVVGLNGAGKSTMIKLLMRLYEPTEGRILLNGVDVRRYKKQSYYRLFAPVFQDVQVFAFSLKENVSMKNSAETKCESVKEALTNAGLADKLQGLPGGIETELLKVIDEEGIDLSGGEKQKIALARALYKEAPIVVLDEPTSAYDAFAENDFYNRINYLVGNKTTIFISHRLSSTKFCDKVVLFQEGEVLEYGTHKELMEHNGSYAKMYHLQAQYYEKELAAQGVN